MQWNLQLCQQLQLVPETREGNRGDSNDGQQFIAEGLPPAVQSALYGGADAEINMTAAGRQTHTHTHEGGKTATETETFEMASK